MYRHGIGLFKISKQVSYYCFNSIVTCWWHTTFQPLRSQMDQNLQNYLV